MPPRRCASADVLAEQVFGTPAPGPRRRVTRLNHGPTRHRVERKKLDSADVLSTMLTEGRDPR